MNNVLFRRGDQTFIDENVPLKEYQTFAQFEQAQKESGIR